ncbi:MAG: hypothetical protein ACEQSR_15300 [Candidatus Methylacidiphilales bacterium]
MNYLSHYYIDYEKNNFYYNGALFLPDFARNVARGFDQEVNGLSKDEIQLHLGCKAHLQADKVFHPSVFFEKYSQIINHELQQFEPLAHINRKWFLAHILMEMMIDRLLVRFFPSVCHQFYDDLSHIDTKILSQFVLRFSNKNIDTFIQQFEHFCKVKYLFGYANDDSFVYSIGRVFKYGSGIEMTMSDKLFLKKLINKIEETHFKDPMIILAELKNVFYK